MTVIKFYNKKNKILKFSINGHTDFEQYGKDIVCASISSTVTLVINGIIEVLKIKKLKYEIDEGYTICSLEELSDIEIDKCQDFIKSLKIFLEQLAKEYPKYVKFEIGRYEL